MSYETLLSEPPSFFLPVLASLDGDYALQLRNNPTTEAGRLEGSTYFVALGVLTFDGAGRIEGRRISHLHGGQVVYDHFQQTFAGTYTVESDGTGTIHIEVEPTYPNERFAGECSRWLPAERYDFVIIDDGRELSLLGVRLIGCPTFEEEHSLIGTARAQGAASRLSRVLASQGASE